MHKVRIVDAEALRVVLREVKELHGTQEKAADWLGIQQPTFNRLLNGTVDGAMSFGTYASILEALGGRVPEHGRAPGPILGFGVAPSELEVERECRRTGEAEDQVRERLWKESNQTAAAEARRYDMFRSSVLTDDADFVWSHYENWLQGEYGRLIRKLKPVFPLLNKHQNYLDLFRNFRERVRGSPDVESEDLRIRFAVLRALEPLSEAEATWGVERSIQEMHSSGDLEPYLKAALKCEEILLRRERDSQRVKDCVPPIDYGAWLAGVGENDYEENNPVSPPGFWEDFLAEEESRGGTDEEGQ